MQADSTHETEMIRDAVARFLTDHGGLDAARAVHDGTQDTDLWQGLTQELGLCALTLPEETGGLNLGPTALVAVAHELGRVLAPVPFAATLGAVAPLLVAARAEPLLAQMAEGRITGALAAWDFDTFTAEATPEGYTLSGRSSWVPDLPKANLILIPARCQGAPMLFALSQLPTIEQGASFDPTHPVGRLTLEGITLSPDSLLDIDAAAFETALSQAHLAHAAEAAGAARGLFELTRAYLSERQQFGRAIASFQAIKHRVARDFVTLNKLDALINGAAQGLESGDPLADAEARAAWGTAREVQHQIAGEAIQLHGGVGVTWEYAPHMFFKRASAQMALPDRAEARFAQIGADLRAGTLPCIPPADDTPFRQGLRDWLNPRLTGPFAGLKDRGHAGDGETLVPERKTWEQELATGGWVGIGLPESAGGRGLSVPDQVAFYEEYARAGGPGRMGHIGEGLVAPTLLAFGTEDQKTRHLPGILKGQTFWAQGYSEPSAGSDLAAVRTKARLDPDTGDWLVTGQKIWTSLAQFSDWIFVLARAEEGSVGRNGLIFLLMPLDQPGIETRPITQMGGGAEFNEVFFDQARAKACDVIGAPGEGWKIAMALLGFERGISTLGQQMGFARELDAVTRLARDPHLDAALGRAWAGLRAMRHGAQAMLSAQAEGRAGPEMLGYKLEWSEWHRALGELAMDALGPDAAAWSNDDHTRLLQHLYLFARADTIYGGTSEIQLNIIAEQGLGMPREPRGKG